MFNAVGQKPSGQGKRTTMKSTNRKEIAPDLMPDSEGCAALEPLDLAKSAHDAAALLKALAHEGRLMILCHLTGGERSVTELEMLLATRQAAVSQQLARLRMDGLVSCRRDGKAIYYKIADPKAAQTVALMYDLYCRPK
jgi:ArsR family transcriptional regulator